MRKEQAIQICMNCGARKIEETLDIIVTPETIYEKLKKGKCPFSPPNEMGKKDKKIKICAEWIKNELNKK